MKIILSLLVLIPLPLVSMSENDKQEKEKTALALLQKKEYHQIGFNVPTTLECPLYPFYLTLFSRREDIASKERNFNLFIQHTLTQQDLFWKVIEKFTTLMRYESSDQKILKKLEKRKTTAEEKLDEEWKKFENTEKKLDDKKTPPQDLAQLQDECLQQVEEISKATREIFQWQACTKIFQLVAQERMKQRVMAKKIAPFTQWASAQVAQDQAALKTQTPKP